MHWIWLLCSKTIYSHAKKKKELLLLLHTDMQTPFCTFSYIEISQTYILIYKNYNNHAYLMFIITKDKAK